MYRENTIRVSFSTNLLVDMTKLMNMGRKKVALTEVSQCRESSNSSVAK